MPQVVAVSGNAEGGLTYELQQARLKLSRLERELVEQETGGHALIGAGAAFRVGTQVGGIYGGIVAGGGALVLHLVVQSKAKAEALEELNKQTLIVFELEQAATEAGLTTIAMPPMWLKDP